MKARAISKSYSMTGAPLVTLEFADKNVLNLDLLDGRDIDVELKQKRAKRSNNANSYMWTLCDKLAREVGSTKNEVYQQAILNVGLYKDFEPMPDGDAKTFCNAWARLGVGWVTEVIKHDEKGKKTAIRAYYGSSVYDSKQMARVIDILTQDCKACGIPTLEDEEVERLIKAHERK